MNPLPTTQSPCRSALLAMGVLALSWLSGCTVTPTAQPASQATTSALPTSPSSQSAGTAQGSASGPSQSSAPQPAPASPVRSPGLSQARNERDYRQDAAKHLYALNRGHIYQGRLPPMLEAVGVLNVDIDKKGAVKRLHWQRAPRHVPKVMKEIERLVQAAAPYPVPQHLNQVTYTDVWLWHQSGKFQLDTLTEGQD